MNRFTPKLTLEETQTGVVAIVAAEQEGDSYQWQYRLPNVVMRDWDDAETPTIQWRNIDGANDSQLELAAPEPIDFQKDYRCVITKNTHQRETHSIQMNYRSGL
ncbi:hypothetical protein V3H38_10940 [Vibrio parahaemolyticus]|uniref:hypothetical protein n=1 Tax=Vibrio parahaemolyticus TaxID=670 RepID=UPI002360B8CD|nr:hypothetical protein [Vibrio parahaemolyticus]